MGKLRNAAEVMGLVAPRAAYLATKSPYSEGQLSPILASDIFGIDVSPVTQQEAMRVPGVAKGRAVLHALIASRPLVAYRGTEKLADQPSWLYRSDDGIPVQYRLGLVLDDMIFRDASMLYVDSRGADGFPLSVSHVAYDRWEIKPDGSIHIDKVQVNPDSVIYIKSPWDGLLVAGADKIRESRNLDRSSAARARNPIAAWDIHLVDEREYEDDELEALKAKVLQARRDPDGAVIVTPPGVELKTTGSGTTDMFETARNAIRLDIANLLNIPASIIEGASEGSSLTYETRAGNRSDLADMSLTYWTTPIGAWLSQDDVVPRGVSVRVDFADYFALPQTVTPTED
jgi:hypothetical protein